MKINQQISERKNAANLARNFFTGQISKNETLINFPDYENDFKIRLLYNRIVQKPKIGWLFGISKKNYDKFILETFDIIEDLETDNLSFKTMKALFRQLWLQSNECSEPIENIAINLHEVSKITYNSKLEIRRYFNLLIEKNFIKKISDEPLLYEFTKSGRKIKTDSEIKEIIINVA